MDPIYGKEEVVHSKQLERMRSSGLNQSASPYAGPSGIPALAYAAASSAACFFAAAAAASAAVACSAASFAAASFAAASFASAALHRPPAAVFAAASAPAQHQYQHQMRAAP